jgi:hypothetical protein
VELVTLEEAAKRVDRSRDTLRRWLRSGALQRHTGAASPRGGSPPVLVDMAELHRLVVQVGASSAPARRTGGHASPALDVDARVAVAELRGELAVARVEADGLRALVAELRTQRDALADRAAVLEARLEALAALQQTAPVSWWRRLTG